MAEYVDVHFFDQGDEPADVWFTDDHGNQVDFMTVDQGERDDGWYMCFRIQANDIERI